MQTNITLAPKPTCHMGPRTLALPFHTSYGTRVGGDRGRWTKWRLIIAPVRELVASMSAQLHQLRLNNYP